MTTLFLLYHGYGHFHACFNAARILQKRGDVVLAGHTSFKEYIERQSFIFYPLASLPVGMGFEEWKAKEEKQKYPSLTALRYRRLNTLFNDRVRELTQLINDVDPTHIFIDAYQATDFLVLYPLLKSRGIRIGLVHTMLPIVNNKALPPINCHLLPSDVKEVQSHYRRARRKQQWNVILNFFRYGGYSDNAIIRRVAAKQKIAPIYLSTQPILRGVALCNISEMILSPLEFDFPHPIPPYQHYAGFQTNTSRIETTDMDYLRQGDNIHHQLQQPDSVLIYCSFGSVKSEFTNRVIRFIDRLIDATQGNNAVLIISVNTVHQEHTFINLPDNVFLLKAAPQLEILQRADVFITHGGLNSIKEAIHFGVPILAYPIHDLADTPGNASRIVYHGLGLRGDLEEDSVDELNVKITELVNNPDYKKNMATLRESDAMYHDAIDRIVDNLTLLH